MGWLGGSKSSSHIENKDQRQFDVNNWAGGNSGSFVRGSSGTNINTVESLKTGAAVANKSLYEMALTADRAMKRNHALGTHALDKQTFIVDSALDYTARNDNNLFATLNNIVDRSTDLATNAMNLKSGETIAQPTNRTISELAPLAVVTAGIIATAIVLPKVL